MEALFHFTSPFAAVAASTLVSAVWEGAVLAGCVFLCLRLMPGLSAAARSVVWLNVFLLLLALHFVPAMGTHGTVGIGERHAPFELGLEWSVGIAAAWAALLLRVECCWRRARSAPESWRGGRLRLLETMRCGRCLR